jgi:cell migration-inducing and hyaluronan-binding protein
MRRANLVAVLLLTLAAMAPAIPASGAPEAAVDWSDEFPTTGNVTIPASRTVVLDTNVNLDGLTIAGTVLCGDRAVSIKARWILVTGTFRCGTHPERFTKRLTITLTGAGNGDVNGYGDKYIAVADGGVFELHGRQRETWTRLAKTAQAGSTTLRLATKTDWKAGDRLVVAPTNYYIHQTEQVQVASRRGSLVTLTAPLSRQHFCGTDRYAGKRVTECAEVGLLTHNIVIEGNGASESSRIGGHLISLAGSRVRIEGAEFRRMGQLGRLGRYPIHFHLVAGTDIGAYVRDSSVHHSYNRLVTIHGTRGVDVVRVVGYDTVGHGFYLEDGSETGNRFLCNLGVLVRNAESGTNVTPSDTQASAFWISNPDNTVERNVAAGAEFAGFWLGFPEHPVGLSANPNVWPRRTPLKSFDRNTAHTVGFAGLYMDGGEDANRNTVTTWFEPRTDPADPNSPHVTPTIGRFTAYKSNHYGIWLRTFSGVKVDGAALADNWRSIYLANISSGPSNDNVGIIRDSLLVGTSSNKGQRESWERADVNGHTVPQHWDPDNPLGGVPFYDGPMRVQDTVLANFKPNATRNAGALTSLFPNVFTISVLNEARGLTFKNSKRVLLPEPGGGRQGDAGTLFTDLDGSVTGTRRRQVVVDPSLLDDSSCSKESSWHASVCKASYARVYVTRNDGGAVGADVTRVANGRTVFVQGAASGDSSMGLNVETNARYHLDFRNGDPSAYTFWTGEFSGGGAVRIAVPAPPGSWTVTIWGISDPEVDSLGDLGSGEAGYYYAPGTGLIHLRFTRQNRGGEIS